MRQRHVFERVVVLLSETALSRLQLASLETCLLDGGAKIVSYDHITPQLLPTLVTHVVCAASQYHDFATLRNDRFVALVRPEWVYKSFLLQKLLPVDSFSANPQMFLSSLVVSAGHIGKDPRKVIDGLVVHFGAQPMESSTVTSTSLSTSHPNSALMGATHVLTSEPSKNKHKSGTRDAADADEDGEQEHAVDEKELVEACGRWKKFLSRRSKAIDFLIPLDLLQFLIDESHFSRQFVINYSWIEECVHQNKRLPEAPFVVRTRRLLNVKRIADTAQHHEIGLEDLHLEPFAKPYESAVPNADVAVLTRKNAGSGQSTPEHISNGDQSCDLNGAIVLLAQHIHPELKQKLSERLKLVNAKVATVPLTQAYKDIVCKVVANASFIVCRYQSGFEFEEAQRQRKKIASVYWAFRHCTPNASSPLGNDNIDAPGNELLQVLDHPVRSFGGIEGMYSFVMTLSGFTSRTVPSREDVQLAIQATGACMLPVLSRVHTTHLICHEAKGEKYQKALSWQTQKIVRCEWLYECLRQWKKLPEEDFGCQISPTTSTLAQKAAPRITTATVDKNPPVVTTATTKEQAESEPEAEAPIQATDPVETRQVVAAKAPSSTGTKRFDVSDVLMELENKTPSKQNDSKNTYASGTGVSLFDTPTAGKDTNKLKEENLDMDKENKSPNEPRSPVIPMDIPEERDDDEEKEEHGPEDQEENEPEKPTMKKATAKGSKTNSKKTSRKRKTQEVKSPTKESARDSTKQVKSVKSSPARKRQRKNSVVDVGEPSSNTCRVFLLTGYHEEHAVNESMIMALDRNPKTTRVIASGRFYDPTCTHIICSELKRTEKFVAGCAAGKWILKPSYLTESTKAGHFVDEADHEWGHDDNDQKHMDDRIWPLAPSFWRQAREKNQPGAFAGWRFLIHPKTVPPADMCGRIIQAADGEVIPLTKQLNLDTLDKTDAKLFALVPPTISSSRDSWFRKFREHSLQCISSTFLIDYLTKDQRDGHRVKLEAFVL